MCFDPISMATIGLQVAGGVTSAMSSVQAGNANARQLMAAAAVGRENAATAFNRGAFQEGRILDTEARASGGQRAHWAASGLDPTMGSPLLMQGFSAAQANIDRLLARSDASQEAANQFEQGSAYASRAKESIDAGWNSAVASILNGAGSLMKMGLPSGGGSSGRSSPAASDPLTMWSFGR